MTNRTPTPPAIRALRADLKALAERVDELERLLNLCLDELEI